MQTSTNSQVETNKTKRNAAAVNSGHLECQQKNSASTVHLAVRATKIHHRKSVEKDRGNVLTSSLNRQVIDVRVPTSLKPAWGESILQPVGCLSVIGETLSMVHGNDNIP